jgi:hypothetical protein
MKEQDGSANWPKVLVEAPRLSDPGLQALCDYPDRGGRVYAFRLAKKRGFSEVASPSGDAATLAEECRRAGLKVIDVPGPEIEQ